MLPGRPLRRDPFRRLRHDFIGLAFDGFFRHGFVSSGHLTFRSIPKLTGGTRWCSARQLRQLIIALVIVLVIGRSSGTQPYRTTTIATTITTTIPGGTRWCSARQLQKLIIALVIGRSRGTQPYRTTTITTMMGA
jgi:hypothetical protein